MRYRNIGGSSGLRVSALCLGTLPFGSTVSVENSFTIMDRFRQAGGTFIDTSNNYVFWLNGSAGDESELTVGAWLAARGIREEVLLSTKCGARPVRPGAGLEAAEGLSARAIERAMAGSLRRLGTDWVDIYWAHIEDRHVTLRETMAAMDGLVTSGRARVLGCSNHMTWRIERARQTATEHGWTRYTCLQNRYSYLQPRSDVRLPESAHMHATAEHLDYVRSEPDLTLMAYTTLLYGAYSDGSQKLPAPYDHPGTPPRLAALGRVVRETGATPNQVVLSWLIDGDPAILPIIGVSSVGQLDELLDAVDLTITADQRCLMDNPGEA